MPKILNPAAPPVPPGAEHILPHEHQHRAWALSLGDGPELLQQRREGQPQWGDPGPPQRNAWHSRDCSKPVPRSPLPWLLPASTCAASPRKPPRGCPASGRSWELPGPQGLGRPTPKQVLVRAGDDLRSCSASQPSASPLTYPGSLTLPHSTRGLLLMQRFLLAVLKPGGDSLILRDLKTSPKENCMQSETESLLEKERRPSLEADPTLQHSSPKQEPPVLGPHPAWGFFRSRPGGSFHSLRRVSSLDNFEAARSEFQRKFRERRANSGRENPGAVGSTAGLRVLAMAPAHLGGEVSVSFPSAKGRLPGSSPHNPLLSM